MKVEIVIPPEFLLDSRFQRRHPVNGRVLGVAAPDRLAARLLDVLGGRKVRFTGTEDDDILAVLAEFSGQRRNRHGGRGANSLNSLGQTETHLLRPS